MPPARGSEPSDSRAVPTSPRQSWTRSLWTRKVGRVGATDPARGLNALNPRARICIPRGPRGGSCAHDSWRSTDGSRNCVCPVPSGSFTVFATRQPYTALCLRWRAARGLLQAPLPAAPTGRGPVSLQPSRGCPPPRASRTFTARGAQGLSNFFPAITPRPKEVPDSFLD